MSRIIKSIGLLAGAAAVIGAGATGAFFGDTETSTGNTFTAGAIDLKIDNESYYNGNACVDTDATAGENWQWQGTADYPTPGTPCTTSWYLDDLNDGAVTVHKFFDFLDLKPDDYSEDTISLHVDSNDAWLCAEVTLTSNDDNTPTEPELLADLDTGVGLGELANLVEFIWWADDGDNVLEGNENVISQGPIGALTLNAPFSITLADSIKNIWNPGQAPGPLAGNTTKYIGKAWCFGTITPSGLTQDAVNNARTPAGDNNNNQIAGEPEDGGFLCDGVGIGDASQTDSLTVDVTFEAMQARHNPNFQCNPPQGGGPCVFDANLNLVQNGGFELPEVTTTPANWDIFPSPADGWNILWRDDVAPPGRPATANIELHEGVLGVAFEGNQYTELDSDWNGHAAGPNGEASATTIYQNIPTQIGAHYSLTYRFAPRPGTSPTDNNLESRLGGVPMDTTGPVGGGGGNLVAGDWVPKGPFDFVATTTMTQLRFTDLGSTNNSLGTFLDDVQLKQTSCVN